MLAPPFLVALCAVAVPAARVAATRSSSTAVSAGYVPDGLTAQQWEDMKKKKEAAAAARKKEVKSKKFEVRCLFFVFSSLCPWSLKPEDIHICMYASAVSYLLKYSNIGSMILLRTHVK